MTANFALSEFLRRRRANLSPRTTGLPDEGDCRRVSGLRREEVAVLAGISADYYTRLEQGTRLRHSDGVLNAVAAALDLAPAERAHLFRLARPRKASCGEPPGGQTLRAGLGRFVDSFSDHAALVLGRRTDVLASNRRFQVLFTDFGTVPQDQRNLARWMVLHPAPRQLFADWEVEAQDLVAMLHGDIGRHPDDRRTARLVNELSAGNEQFRAWWVQHRVVEPTTGHTRLHHTRFGDLTVEYQVFTVAGLEDQTLFLYLPARDRQSREAWRRLDEVLSSPETAIPEARMPLAA
ncbi:transcriptional regulator with XRE-family HTH domain [Crossiella equi]|uniref:Transcriptional regulator with XRE-family HTH domain n=1 Tax=Crossiella equi TaxID=130796 RepID=A0ABS5AR37_9PSEU|nr:helix-turn-helix transcriptional regulator [Crossiella equi]MBP2478872.1 transcriptional regulator with XRE-family HTH domain [Crossiella equi]